MPSDDLSPGALLVSTRQQFSMELKNRTAYHVLDQSKIPSDDIYDFSFYIFPKVRYIIKKHGDRKIAMDHNDKHHFPHAVCTVDLETSTEGQRSEKIYKSTEVVHLGWRAA